MDSYYNRMTGSVSDRTTLNPNGFTFTTGSGYTCPYCGQWVPDGTAHVCPAKTYIWPSWNCVNPHVNPTEQAYRILKALVENKTIPEPDSYAKFCELIETIKKAL